jgi:integrase
VRLDVKGVHRVTKRLASGEIAVYHYAWRGGPRIPGEPGSPEFLSALAAATAETPHHHKGTLQEIINAYQASPAFLDKAEATREGYKRRLPAIEAEFGDMPIKALADPRVRGEFLDWRDQLAKKSAREADYHMAILALIMGWGVDRGRVPANPAAKPGRLYQPDRTDNIWTDADVSAFLAKAGPQLRLPFLIALWTGQRRKDVLRMAWGAYDGTVIRLAQSKGKRRVVIPVAAELKAALDAAKRKAAVICTTSRGTPWTGDGFSASFRKAQEAAGLEGVTFHDLRGTAVTRLAIAGCTDIEIATITGHSLKTVKDMLDRHYLSRDIALAESAVAKLEQHRAGTGTVNRPVNRSRDQGAG